MVSNQCRLCLTSSESNIYVLENHELLNKIKECVSIEISPTEIYSKVICADCLEKVYSWHNFKTMCLNSKITLEARIIEENKNKSVLTKEGSNCKIKTTRRDSVIKKNASPTSGEQEYENMVLKIEFDETSCLNTSYNDVNIPYSPSDIEYDSEKNVGIESKAQLSQGNEDYICDFCTKTFAYYTDYLDHQTVHDGQAIFNCEICKLTFSTRQELAWHEKRHKIPCHICGTAVQKQSMKSHLNKHTDKFRCIHCSLTFTCGALLKEHVAARHMKVKQYFCDTCGKVFATKSSLTLHLKIHSKEKLYKCNKCEYAGRTSIALRIHMSKHENGTYICEYCSKIFKSIRNLGDHLRRVHKCVKKYSCDFCDMKFSLRIGDDNCCILRISEPLKQIYAVKHNLKLHQLMSDGPYKEQYRLDMINWSDDIRKTDPSFFCREACKTAPVKKIWIVSDIRRKTDIKWFKDNYQHIQIFRISADLNVRQTRGWTFTKGVDDVESECNLDDFNSWDMEFINNNGEDCEKVIKYILNVISL